MRRGSIVSSVLIMSLAAASPLQRSHNKRDYSPTSWNPLRLLMDKAGFSSHEEKRDTYNCTDLGASFDARCWNDLNLTTYLFNWNATTRVCDEVQSAADNDGSNCCKPDEPWTTCYLRLAHGSPGQDCSQINPQMCTYSSLMDPYMDPSIKPEVQYVMKNIYCESNCAAVCYVID